MRILLHDHPPQSPDLNPIEGIWLLLKERLKQLYKDQLNEMTYWEFKRAVQRCWSLIELQEIRERIDEMPERCKQLIQQGGARIKGSKW